MSLGNASPMITESAYSSDKEKTDRKKKKEDEKDAAKNKNLHSVKKWKITIQYTNGTMISKTIVVADNSKLSALETAFAEADKYLENKRNVKEYSVSPVTSNYVLLAGD
ncbi:hypothetical protein GCM10022259_34680 [Aquimarina mytili]